MNTEITTSEAEESVEVCVTVDSGELGADAVVSLTAMNGESSAQGSELANGPCNFPLANRIVTVDQLCSRQRVTDLSHLA